MMRFADLSYKKNFVSSSILTLSYVVAITFFISICVISIYVLYFGVEAWDEAFYIATSYNLVLGRHAFIDEFNIIQGAAFFTYPFFKLFYLIRGTTQGIFLFSRYLYFLFSLSFSILVASVFSKKISLRISLVIGSLCLIFVPFNLHGLGYNTLGMMFLTTSLFLNFWVVDECLYVTSENTTKDTVKNILSLIAGIFLAFAVIAYPSFLLVFPVAVLCLYVAMPSPVRYKNLLIYFFGLLVGSIWYLAILIQIGIKQLLVDFYLAESIGVQGRGLSKLISISSTFWNELPHQFWLIVFCCLMVLISYSIRNQKIKNLLLFAITILIFYLVRMPITMQYLVYIALFAPFLYFTVRENEYNKCLLLVIWFPALIAGLITSWSSSNGIYNFIIGLFPAALISLCFFAELSIKSINSFIKDESIAEMFAILCIIFVIYPIIPGDISNYYADNGHKDLTSKITYGVFSGIYTTPAKKNYYESLERSIRSLSDSNKSILFFDDFPVGYLMSDLRPATNAVWLPANTVYTSFDRHQLLEYYQRKNLWPYYIVKILRMAENPNPAFYPYKYSATDPIIQLVERYKLVISNSDYEIYQIPK